VPSTVTRDQLVEALERLLVWVREHPQEAAQRYAQYTYGGLDYVAGIERKPDVRYAQYRPWTHG
jgi:ABC-type nitrate/sulfonate/bicarbonate transport system substrate-binding protein